MTSVPDECESKPSLHPGSEGAAESPRVIHDKIATRDMLSNLEVRTRLGKLQTQQEWLSEKLTKVLELLSGRPSTEGAPKMSTEQQYGLNQSVRSSKNRLSQIDSGDSAWLDVVAKLKTQQCSIDFLKEQARKIMAQLCRIESSPGIDALKEESKEMKAQLDRIVSNTGVGESNAGIVELLTGSNGIKAQLGRIESNGGIDAWKEESREIKVLLGRIASTPHVTTSKADSIEIKDALSRIEWMVQPMSGKTFSGDQDMSSEMEARLGRIESMLQLMSEKVFTDEQEEAREIKVQLGRIESMLQRKAQPSPAMSEMSSMASSTMPSSAGRQRSLGSPKYQSHRISPPVQQVQQIPDQQQSRGRTMASAPPPRTGGARFVTLPHTGGAHSPPDCRTPSPQSMGRTGPANYSGVASGVARSLTPVAVRTTTMK